MAKTVAQIMAELDKSGGYAANRNLLSGQLKALPGQSKAQISGLDAKLGQANSNILQGARSRGLGWSGAPIEEQMQYAATEYAPAVARVKQSQNDQQTGILQSLNSLDGTLRSQAQSIFDNNRTYDLQQRTFREQQRQFNEQQKLDRETAARDAAASASGPSAGDYLSAIMGGGGSGQAAPSVSQNGSSFAFKDANGKAITAAQYAKGTNQSIGNVLYAMGQGGNKTAAQLYSQLQNVAGNPKSYNNAIKMYKKRFPYVFGGA